MTAAPGETAGGIVAMDSVRTALRLGADNAYIVYRRGMEELPARREVVEHAQHEGVQIKILTAPVKVLGNKEGWVTSLERAFFSRTVTFRLLRTDSWRSRHFPANAR